MYSKEDLLEELNTANNYIKELEQSIINTTKEINAITEYLNQDSNIIYNIFIKSQEENKELRKRNEDLLDHLIHLCKIFELKIDTKSYIK